MDHEGIAAGTQHLRQPGTLSSASEIEEYTEYLFGFLKDLVECTVPYANPSPGYACPWWTLEVKEAVQVAKVARHQRAPPEVMRSLYSHKKKAIRSARRLRSDPTSTKQPPTPMAIGS